MTNPQATTTVSKLDFALVEVSQSKTPFYSEQNEEFENQLSARRQLLRFILFCKLHKKGVKPESFAP